METLRKILPYSAIAIAIAAIYSGWTFYSRSRADKAAEAARANAQASANQYTVDALGGGNMKILMFYGTPGVIRKGQTVQFCYGVAYAKKVTIEPFIDDVWPSMTRCMEGKPKKTTEYTLTATDAQGHSQLQKLTVVVK